MLTRLPVVVLAAFLIVAVVDWRLDLRSELDDDIPIRFLFWASMPLAAVGIAVFGWRGERRWRRVASILAVPLSTMYAANLINQCYEHGGAGRPWPRRLDSGSTVRPGSWCTPQADDHRPGRC